MAITIRTAFDSAVVQFNQDIFVKSYIEDGITIIEFDVRKRNYKKKLGIKAKIKWCDKYSVDIDELSTVYTPIKYRFIIAQGYYNDLNGKRIFFTPEIEEVSTSQHVSKSTIRISCYLAVICGVSLRNIATIISALFLISITKSSIKRWIDEIGDNLPNDEELLKNLIDQYQPTECHIDGYYPMGTDNCVMVIKDEIGRILITHETKSENKEEAKKFLEKLKKAGIIIKKAFSDYSTSFTESIKEVFPEVKFQADHFHTVKNIWKHLWRALLEYRREIKSEISEENTKSENDEIEKFASKLWKLRWLLLKKPVNLNNEEKRKIRELSKHEKGEFVKEFRSILKKIVSIFDKSKTEKSAIDKLKILRLQIEKIDNKHYNKVIKFFKVHWDQALQYLKKNEDDFEGTDENIKNKRASNSETGMRLLRRLEKNHDGIRSKKTRKNYIKIYQQIKYFSSDITDFITQKTVLGKT